MGQIYKEKELRFKYQKRATSHFTLIKSHICIYMYLIYVSFSNEPLNVFFKRFCTSYIFDLANTVWAQRVLSQKSSRNFEWTNSTKLGPKDVPRTSPKDVLWTSPYCPLCNGRDVPYRRPENVPIWRPEDVPITLWGCPDTV